MLHVASLEGVAAPPLFNPGGKLPDAPLPNIVAFYSPSRRTGKSTAARVLADYLQGKGHKAVVISFADALRALCGRALLSLGYSSDASYAVLTQSKDSQLPSTAGVVTLHALNPTSHPKFTFSGRDLLVAVGDGVRDILGEDAWVQALRSRIANLHLSKHDFIIIDDLRRPNEYAWLFQINACLVRLTRAGLQKEDTEAHEGQLENCLFDYMADLPAGDGFSKLQSEMKVLADVLSRSA